MAKKKDKGAKEGKMGTHLQNESPHRKPFHQGPSNPQDIKNNGRTNNMPSTLTADGVEHKRNQDGPREFGENKSISQLDMSVPAGRKSYTECAVLILREQANRKPMHYREITKEAMKKGILHTNGLTPEATLYAQVLMENRRRESRAEQPRFICLGKGMIGLTEWKNDGDISALIERANQQVKKHMLGILRTMEPRKFEELVTCVFAALGFSDATTTQSTRDGGVDVRGVLEVAGNVKIPIAVQVKRYGHNVGTQVVSELRGSLGIGERGIVVSTSGFTKTAKENAADNHRGGGIVDLIDGNEFVNLMVTHGIWVERHEYTLLSIVQNPDVE